MKGRGKMIRGLAILALLPWIAGLPVTAQDDQDWVYGDDYQPGDFGRVKYLENGVSIVRAAADPGMPPLEDAGLNAPVFPGDMLRTGFDQRVEIELASGSVVRVDRATDVAFLALPDPYSEFADNTVLQLAEGTIQTTAFLGESEEFRIDTPTASIYLLGDGDFRIEVDAQGRTRVISSRGVAEVVGEGGSVLVRGGMLSEVYAGSFPLSPTPFNSFNTDTFDRWVDDRESLYVVRDRYGGEPEYVAEVYDELPGEVQPYYRELTDHGDWVYTDDYGYVWYPTEVSSEWRPYHDGYWDYGTGGYFWVSHEPWGWAPYHYGRWDWIGGYGWVWVPGRVFAGAWVAWSWGSVHVGWAPLSYWNTPVYVGSVYYDYYSPHCWTFVNYNHIHYRDYTRYAVPLERVGHDLHGAAVLTRPPRVSPRQLSESADWRRRAVRDASTDSAAQIKNPYRDRVSPRNMRQVENSLVRRNAVRRGATTDRETTAARPRAQRRDAGSSVSRTKTSYPRRTDTSVQSRSRPDTRTSRSAARPSVPSRRVDDRGVSTPTRQRPQRTSINESAQRVRDLYRSMASPRTTRQRSGGSPGSSRVERTPSRTGSSRLDRTPTRSNPARSSASPSRTAPSRTTSTVPRSSSRSRTTARPQPSATRSGGTKSGPKPSARPSSPSRSSGSRSGARPKSTPRKNSSPGARPSSRSGGSPSRSTGARSGSKSSGTRAKSTGSRSRSGRKR